MTAMAVLQRIGVNLARDERLRPYSPDVSALVAQKLLSAVLDGCHTPAAISLRLAEDDEIVALPPLVLAAVVPPVLDCVAAALRA